MIIIHDSVTFYSTNNIFDSNYNTFGIVFVQYGTYYGENITYTHNSGFYAALVLSLYSKYTQESKMTAFGNKAEYNFEIFPDDGITPKASLCLLAFGSFAFADGNFYENYSPIFSARTSDVVLNSCTFSKHDMEETSLLGTFTSGTSLNIDGLVIRDSSLTYSDAINTVQQALHLSV